MSRRVTGRITVNPSGTFTASVPVAFGSAKRESLTFQTRGAAEHWRRGCVTALEAGQPLPVDGHGGSRTAVEVGNRVQDRWRGVRR